MAYRTWQGDSSAIAQVGTHAVTSTAVATITITVTDENAETTAIAYAPTAAAVASKASGLADAWNNSGSPAAQRATASAATTGIITLTADTAGVPFDVTAVAGTGLGAYTAVTANAGPNDWDDVQNWKGGNKPGADDQVIIARGSAGILYNLGRTGDGAFASFKVEEGANGTLGGTDGADLAMTLTDSSSATNVELNGTGQSFLKFVKTTSSTVNGPQIVVNQSYIPSSGQHGANIRVGEFGSEGAVLPTLTVNRGNVGIHTDESDDAIVVTNLQMGYIASARTDANVTIGHKAHVLTVEKTGGYLTLQTGSSTVGCTIIQDQGSILTEESVVVTTMTLNGGSAILKSSGTVTTLNINNASVDMSKDQRVGTITTVKLNKGGSLRKSTTAGTLTNNIQTDDSATFSAS